MFREYMYIYVCVCVYVCVGEGGESSFNILEILFYI